MGKLSECRTQIKMKYLHRAKNFYSFTACHRYFLIARPDLLGLKLGLHLKMVHWSDLLRMGFLSCLAIRLRFLVLLVESFVVEKGRKGHRLNFRTLFLVTRKIKLARVQAIEISQDN